MTLSPRTSFESPERWFDEADVAGAVRSLRVEVSQVQVSVDDPSVAPRPDDTVRLTVGVVAVVLAMLALLVGVLVLFGKRDPNHQLNLRSYITLAAVFVGLPIAVFVWVRFFYGKKAGRHQERSEALRHLVRRNGALAFGNGTKVTGRSVGVVPWLASEIDKVVECDLHGTYRGHALTLVHCTYVVDMTLSAIEDSLGKLGAAIMSHVEHEHIHRRSLEAVVFFEPLPTLPDMFWAANKQPLNWYFKRQVGNVQPLDGQPAWLVSSDPRRCRQALSPTVQQLLAGKPEAILQALGGCLIVIPQTWSANRPVEMPNQVDEIQKNLDWACDLYEALGGGTSTATAAAPLVSSHPEAVPTNPQDAEAPQKTSACVEAALAAPPKGFLRIAALVCGLLVGGFGALTLFSMIYLTMKANSTAAWPTADGRILEATVAVKGDQAKRWSAQVRYDYEIGGTRYEGRRLSIGSTDWVSDSRLPEGLVAKYPQGQAVKVYYNPKRHEDAVLEPGLGSSLSCFMVFGGVSTLAGLALLYYGIRRPRLRQGVLTN